MLYTTASKSGGSLGFGKYMCRRETHSPIFRQSTGPPGDKPDNQVPKGVLKTTQAHILLHKADSECKAIGPYVYI
jgi:hypothetical protein